MRSMPLLRHRATTGQCGRRANAHLVERRISDNGHQLRDRLRVVVVSKTVEVEKAQKNLHANAGRVSVSSL